MRGKERGRGGRVRGLQEQATGSIPAERLFFFLFSLILPHLPRSSLFLPFSFFFDFSRHHLCY